MGFSITGERLGHGGFYNSGIIKDLSQWRAECRPCLPNATDHWTGKTWQAMPIPPPDLEKSVTFSLAVRTGAVLGSVRCANWLTSIRVQY